jgi:hypothetical protein
MNADEPALCGKPCPPDNSCDECTEYWIRMEREGYWDRVKHEWTPKGLREMMK